MVVMLAAFFAVFLVFFVAENTVIVLVQFVEFLFALLVLVAFRGVFWRARRLGWRMGGSVRFMLAIGASGRWE